MLSCVCVFILSTSTIISRHVDPAYKDIFDTNPVTPRSNDITSYN